MGEINSRMQRSTSVNDSSNNLYLTGYTDGNLSGTNAGSFDAWLAKYDANGNQTLQIRELWDGTAWQNNAKYTYTYNAANQQTQAIYETWSSNATSWVNAGRITNTYNANQRLIKIATDTWNGAWQPTTKQDWYYNASNELQTKETFLLVNSSWEGQSRLQYVYAFGFVSNLIESIWNNGGWVLSKQTTHLVNGSVTPARIVSTTNYKRDLINNTWGYQNRTYYGYSANLLTSVQSELYDSSAGIWRSSVLITNTYNTNNLLSEEVTQQYNSATSAYNNDTRKVLTYNGNDLNDQTTYFIGFGSSGWATTKRDQFTYNAKDSLTYWREEDYINSNFVPAKQHFYYYNDIVVGLNNFNNLFVNATLYPNPAANTVSIKTNDKINGAYLAVIYSLDGKRVWSQLNTNTIQEFNFDISLLQAGNYVLQLNEISSGKAQHFKLNKQ